MGAYGDNLTRALTKRLGVVAENAVFTAHFTTANTAAPTVDVDKTRAVDSVTRTGVGVFRVALPFKMRNCVVGITPFAYPAGAIVNGWKVSHAEGDAFVDVTVVVISTGAAGDTTGLTLAVRIEGRVV